jgi:hypothetical protein
LNQHFSLSDEPLKAIAAQLKDDDNRSIQIAAMIALGNQSDLPNEIIQVIAARLESSEDPNVQAAAIETLGKQPDLSNEILHALVPKLKIWCSRNQSAAIKVLSKQSSLPEEILNAIAAQLIIYDSRFRDAHIKILGYRLRLRVSAKLMYTIAGQRRNDPSPIELAEKMLRKRREFYLKLLQGPYAPSLYIVLLRQSFTEDLSWYVDDEGNSIINMPGDGERIVIDKQHDMNAMIKQNRPVNCPAQ